ncbi:MAG: carbonic anhydrase [Bryobacter sp.]|jgi:carbonic anhydrase|nr:carbonic anhydrase [Bryobacter sp.]
MVQLAEGVRIFKERVFPKRREFFARLARQQNPEVLFITCADSRVVPSLITHTNPGELFVERNPGNIVPVYSEESVGVSASIEYAVAVLGVKHIIVCGHSDCGAVKGILHPEKLTPAVARWLEYGTPALREVEERFPHHTEEQKLRRLTDWNVITQMGHLQGHPSVRERLAAGELEIHGWVYEIGTGEVYALHPVSNEFAPWPPAA